MKMQSDLFNIGSKIEIERIGDDKNLLYPSQILDIIDEKNFLISGPIYKNNLVLLHKEEDIYLFYIIENKGKYSFKAKVLERDYTSIYKLKIQRISKINRIQQREFFRFPVCLQVKKEYLAKDGKKIINIKENCETKDISGNGMKLLCNFKHSVGDKVRCSIKIYHKEIKVEGQVLRVGEIDAFNYKYSLGITFTDIDEDERELIIKFIFEQQRIMRDKGLI